MKIRFDGIEDLNITNRNRPGLANSGLANERLQPRNTLQGDEMTASHRRRQSNALSEELAYLSENVPRENDLYQPTNSKLLYCAKRLVDIAGAVFFFVVFGWLYFVLWSAVMFTSRGPGMYSQIRLGKDGKFFRLYKFRSMVHNSGEVLESYLKINPEARRQWNDFQKLERDPRITWFGRFIRRTSLDELPQFWNVLKGDMSLVGPRPCMVEQQKLYGSEWKYYCAVRPGLTGLWQVSGRNQLSYTQRVELDSHYVKNISVQGDFLIFMRTIWVVVTGHGSR